MPVICSERHILTLNDINAPLQAQPAQFGVRKVSKTATRGLASQEADEQPRQPARQLNTINMRAFR